MSIFKKSLTGQAEQINTYDAYKELIVEISNMDYEELYDRMTETKTILNVLCRKDTKVDREELLNLTSNIIQLGATFLEANDYPLPFEGDVVRITKPYTGYTYEFIEKKLRDKGEL